MLVKVAVSPAFGCPLGYCISVTSRATIVLLACLCIMPAADCTVGKIVENSLERSVHCPPWYTHAFCWAPFTMYSKVPLEGVVTTSIRSTLDVPMFFEA